SPSETTPDAGYRVSRAFLLQLSMGTARVIRALTRRPLVRSGQGAVSYGCHQPEIFSTRQGIRRMAPQRADTLEGHSNDIHRTGAEIDDSILFAGIPPEPGPRPAFIDRVEPGPWPRGVRGWRLFRSRR